jgi:hypothetical protein
MTIKTTVPNGAVYDVYELITKGGRYLYPTALINRGGRR